MPKSSASALAAKAALLDDFPAYAQACLRIRTKEGAILPLRLNAAQLYIHQQAQEQIQRKGWVRKIIVKGRQQGCSTYVEGRFYWRVTQRRGVRAFILTHEQEATNNLFGMAARYHEHCPVWMRPQTGAANAKELVFDLLDSDYKVGTAGTKGAGRSQTIQLFHGSEVAYWPFAETHAAGVMQAIPAAPDTEVWLESTANGASGYFHSMWRKAIAGEGDYEPIFIPWYWQPEYRRLTEPLKRTEEEQSIAEAYGLSDEQIAWRRAKIAELDVTTGEMIDGGATGEDRFRQEYPNTAEEAFQAPIMGAYYGKTMADLEREGRIRKVHHEPSLSVHTAWDLGIGDSTAIWFAQLAGQEVRIIDYYENSGVGLEHYVGVLKSKPYSYGEHLWPHDADNSELGTGRTRVQTLNGMGVAGRVLPNSSVDDGINAARLLLKKCWFDAEKCARGIECLKQYRREFNEERKVYMPKPLHDWTSDAADAFRYLAMGLPDAWSDLKPKDRYASPKKSGGSWMAA